MEFSCRAMGAEPAEVFVGRLGMRVRRELSVVYTLVCIAASRTGLVSHDDDDANHAEAIVDTMSRAPGERCFETNTHRSFSVLVDCLAPFLSAHGIAQVVERFMQGLNGQWRRSAHMFRWMMVAAVSCKTHGSAHSEQQHASFATTTGRVTPSMYDRVLQSNFLKWL